MESVEREGLYEGEPLTRAVEEGETEGGVGV